MVLFAESDFTAGWPIQADIGLLGECTVLPRVIANTVPAEITFDLNTGRADILISDEELSERRQAFEAAGGYKYPASQTPWQEMQRAVVGQLETGAVLEPAVKYHRIVDTIGLPRDSH